MCVLGPQNAGITKSGRLGHGWEGGGQQGTQPVPLHRQSLNSSVGVASLKLRHGGLIVQRLSALGDRQGRGLWGDIL